MACPESARSNSASLVHRWLPHGCHTASHVPGVPGNSGTIHVPRSAGYLPPAMMALITHAVAP
jgi:hypothetical protein